jgi:hypothetical protein
MLYASAVAAEETTLALFETTFWLSSRRFAKAGARHVSLLRALGSPWADTKSA